jgi:hypothetical protein
MQIRRVDCYIFIKDYLIRIEIIQSKIYNNSIESLPLKTFIEIIIPRH